HDAVDVVLVLGMVVDLERYAVLGFLLDHVLRRLEREESENRLFYLVVEIAAAVVRPFLVEIAWRKRDLIRHGRYGRLERHPVGVAAEEAELPRRLVVDLRHAR